MDELTDDDLVRMYRDGDADAFDVLFDRHHVAVYNLARTMLDGVHHADDVLQETFLRVARAARTYSPQGRFRPWLMRIARNLCINRLKRERAQRAALAEAGFRRADGEADGPGPAELAERADQAERLRRLIADLPERQREALALYAFEGASYREVGRTMDVPLGTVKTLIHRARASLAGAYEENTEEQTDEL